jgi:hypothetical protein
MNKKVVVESLVLSLLFVVLATSVNIAFACTPRCGPSCIPPAIPDSDFTEHENAGGVTRILVPGQREILITADHMDSCVFGSADRILVGVSAASSGVGGPFRPVVAFEDNPRRYAFSVSLGSNHEHCLVKPWQIQIFRIGKTVFVIWTISLVAPATTFVPGTPPTPATPEVVIPPGMLVFRGKGEPYYQEFTSPAFPSGWTYKFETWKRYDADVYFYCRGWDFSGPLTPPSPYMIADRTVTWTAP